MINGLLRLMLFWSAALALVGCANPVTKESLHVQVEVLDALRKYERVYLIQPGDQLEVFIYRHPELSRKTAVLPDGFISLPLVNGVKAAGKTSRELSEHLTELFGRRLKDPEITIMVENAQEPMVYVIGEVGTAKSLPLRQAKTVAQALALSGGATKAGSLSGVAIIRVNEKGQLEARTVNTDGLNQPKTYMALSSMLLMPNDLVLVPESYRGQTIRLIQDFNTLITPYFQLRLLEQVSK